MKNVFVSYAHEDAEFVERLYADLREAGVVATYDKMLLDVGDSIVDRISAIVTDSACVVGVVSPASVTSSWVRKELAWAMTGELAGKVKVLPAVIRDCELPPMLADKLYADFRDLYFPPLRGLLRSIRRWLDSNSEPATGQTTLESTYDEYLSSCQDVEERLRSRDVGRIHDWLSRHPAIIADLAGNLLDTVLPAPRLRAEPPMRAFVCWTIATSNLWHLVGLGPLARSEMTADSITLAAGQLAAMSSEYLEDPNAFMRACMLLSDLLSKELEEQTRVIEPGSARSAARPRETIPDRLILLAGRRDDYAEPLMSVRARARRELGIDIRSYDWLLEKLGGRHYRQVGSHRASLR